MSQFKKFSNLHNEDLVVIPSPSAASSGDVLTLNAEGDLDWTSISTVSAITAIDTRLSNLESDLTDMKTESLADPEIMYVYGQDSNGNIANKPLIVATDFIDQSVPAQTPSLTFNRYKETSSEPGADQSFNELTITKTDSNDNQVFIRTILPPKPSFIDVGNSTFLKYWNESDGGHIDWKPVNEVPVSTSAESGKVLKVGSNGTPSWGNPPDGVYILNYSEVSDLNDIDINRVKSQPTFMKVDTDITVTIPTSDTPYTVSVQQGTLMAIDEIGPEGTSGSYTGPKFISFYANNGKNVGGGIMQNADLKLLCMVSLRPFGGVAKAWGANGFLNNDGALLGGTMPAPVTFKCANSRGPGEDTVTTNHALKVEIQSFGRIRTQSLLPAEIETHDFATDETPEEIQFMGWGVTSNRAGYRTINEVPVSTSAESGKVLTVDSNGAAVWAPSGGGAREKFIIRGLVYPSSSSSIFDDKAVVDKTTTEIRAAYESGQELELQFYPINDTTITSADIDSKFNEKKDTMQPCIASLATAYIPESVGNTSFGFIFKSLQPYSFMGYVLPLFPNNAYEYTRLSSQIQINISRYSSDANDQISAYSEANDLGNWQIQADNWDDTNTEIYGNDWDYFYNTVKYYLKNHNSIELEVTNDSVNLPRFKAYLSDYLFSNDTNNPPFLLFTHLYIPACLQGQAYRTEARWFKFYPSEGIDPYTGETAKLCKFSYAEIATQPMLPNLFVDNSSVFTISSSPWILPENNTYITPTIDSSLTELVILVSKDTIGFNAASNAQFTMNLSLEGGRTLRVRVGQRYDNGVIGYFNYDADKGRDLVSPSGVNSTYFNIKVVGRSWTFEKLAVDSNS